MKRLVICYDGTWNALMDPDTVTNVVRLGQAVRKVSSKDKVVQMVYYNAGVGSGGPLDRFLGGVFGAGLRNNVKRGLAFLTLNYDPDGQDEIYIFGFSRGAYSARALAGVIGAIGGIPKQEHFDRLEDIWNYYRTDPNTRKKDKAKLKIEDVSRYIHGGRKWAPGDKPLIKCLGVWDTVGSYGVPAGLGLGALARKVTSWTRGFHDNTVSSHIEVALHAMAIDERRRAFPPTAWEVEADTPPKDPADKTPPHVEQVWFPGSHSNIGGGYKRSGLADLALIWMMARVGELTKLDFDDQYIADHFWPCACCSLYNSDRGWVVSELWPYLRPVLGEPFAGEVFKDGAKKAVQMRRQGEQVHWSVIERLNRDAIVDENWTRKYVPKNLPKDLPDDLPPAAPKDDRVAYMTRRESDLIDLCRKGNQNQRVQGCALSCNLKKIAEEQSPILAVLGPVGNMLSRAQKRVQRLRKLRKNWDMPDIEGDRPQSS